MIQLLRVCLPMQRFMGLISGQGTKIPQAAGQLSPCMATEEACVPQLLSPFAQEPVLCNKRSPRATTRESLHAATKGPHVAMKTQSSKKKKKKKKKKSFTFLLQYSEVRCCIFIKKKDYTTPFIQIHIHYLLSRTLAV